MLSSSSTEPFSSSAITKVAWDAFAEEDSIETRDRKEGGWLGLRRLSARVQDRGHVNRKKERSGGRGGGGSRRLDDTQNPVIPLATPILAVSIAAALVHSLKLVGSKAAL